MPIRFNPLNYPRMIPHDFFVRAEIAWVKHLPFANLLVELAMPRLLVELGTHTGVSYCTFCQAVLNCGLETKCFAVDTWAGDSHIGHYSDSMLAMLREYHDPRYGAFSKLIQSTFDAALPQFTDGSIDILHIDGLHTYEAVKHDFETWRPKVSDAGVILFHDTANKSSDFGVHRLWAELENQHLSFNFPFGNGLGVLAFGTHVPDRVNEFLEDARANASAMNRHFNMLGERYQLVAGARFTAAAMLRQSTALNNWKAKTGKPQITLPDRRMVEASPFGLAELISRDVEALASEGPPQS